MKRTDEEKATIEGQMFTHAPHNEELQDNSEALAAWAMRTLGFTSDEIYLASALAMKVMVLLQEYQQHREQAQAARVPQRIAPTIARLWIVPDDGVRSYLSDGDFSLHQTALVGSTPGPGRLATLYEYQQPFFCHEDQSCIQMVGEIFRGKKPAPVRLNGWKKL